MFEEEESTFTHALNENYQLDKQLIQWFLLICQNKRLKKWDVSVFYILSNETSDLYSLWWSFLGLVNLTLAMTKLSTASTSCYFIYRKINTQHND